MLSDNGRGDDYQAMFHVIIDSKEGLEEFFRWCQEPKRRDFFRVEGGSNLLSESSQEDKPVRVLPSWRDFDDFCERESETISKSEMSMLKSILDNLIEIFNSGHEITVFGKKSELFISSSYLSYNGSILENNIGYKQSGVEIFEPNQPEMSGNPSGFKHSSDRYIKVYKFVDQWWTFEFYLPQLSSPEGGDTVYFICDSKDGLLDLPSAFKKYLIGSDSV